MLFDLYEEHMGMCKFVFLIHMGNIQNNGSA